MGNQQTKNAQKNLEDKKKALNNLNNKKEKLDRLHTKIEKDFNIKTNHPNDMTRSLAVDSSNKLNYNNTINITNSNRDDNNDYNSLKKNFTLDLNSNHYQNNFQKFPNNSVNLNYQNNKNNLSDNRFNFQADNNVIDNLNYHTNKSLHISKNNVNNINNLNENNYNNKNNVSIPTKNIMKNMKNNINEKLERDLETMEKLIERYKIMYKDSYYFKREKNFQEAINSNIKGQESLDRLLIILSEKNDSNYEKYITIAYHLKNEFIVLYQEIEEANKKNGGKNLTSTIVPKIVNNNYSIQSSNPNPKNNIGIKQNNNNNYIDNNPKHSNLDNDILEKIKSEILCKKPDVKFDEIVGLLTVKQALREIIIIPSLRPDLFTGLRTPAKGLLLFGPPGTGKTLIAKAVATECNSTFFNISASTLTSKYVGESEKLVRGLFEVAHYPENQPAIIFIDEIESILSKRSENDNEVSKRLKTEFLIQFDGVATNSTDRVLVIGATNRPQDLDPAVLRRLPKKIYVGPMDLEGRSNFIFEIMKKIENNLSKNDLKQIALKTENYSNSDLKELCRQACFEPIRELQDGQLKSIAKLRAINLSDMIKAVAAVRGTLSKDILEEYNKWNMDNGAIN